jgi:hypothetical protein
MNELLRQISIDPELADKLNEGVLQPDDLLAAWLPLVEASKSGHRMGLSMNGLWVVENHAGLVSLEEATPFIFVLPLLERPISQVKKEIHHSVGTEKLAKSVETVFPFVSIIKAGLEKRSEYWAELALGWFEELSGLEQQQLTDALKEVSRAKWASQKLRHRVMRLLSGAGAFDTD